MIARPDTGASYPSLKPWKPTRFLRLGVVLDSSMRTARIQTDAGPAYLKALGNPEGPHHLACDLVGTHLAAWLGLPTFDVAIMELRSSDEISLGPGHPALPGPALVFRAERGHPWSGTPAELKQVENLADLSRLVVLDTWIRNRDRCAPAGPNPRRPNRDNVFLSEEKCKKGRFRLVAMDHTHAFATHGPLDSRLSQIDQVKDEAVYGIFPEFRCHLKPSLFAMALDKLGTMSLPAATTLVHEIPDAWEVSHPAREALANLIYERARFLSSNPDLFRSASL